MNDHFWPALYPALIVGALCGLSLGGWRQALLGAVGALAAIWLEFQIYPSSFGEGGLLPLLGFIVVSAVGAFIATGIARWLTRPRSS